MELEQLAALCVAQKADMGFIAPPHGLCAELTRLTTGRRKGSEHLELESLSCRAKKLTFRPPSVQTSQAMPTLFMASSPVLCAELTRPHPGGTGGDLRTWCWRARRSPSCTAITYTSMPPAKRFRDMDQLSGGEKARAGWFLSTLIQA